MVKTSVLGTEFGSVEVTGRGKVAVGKLLSSPSYPQALFGATQFNLLI